MRPELCIDKKLFARDLSQEITAGGLTVIDAIEKLLSEHLEESLSQSLGDHITKRPRAIVHPMYYKNRFDNLAALARTGYSTWYSEVRFSTRKGHVLHTPHLRTSGFELGSIRYGGGIERRYTHRSKELKTQVNHTFRLNKVIIPSDVFAQTINELSGDRKLSQPYIANLTVGFESFVDDRIQGFRTVSFDHVITGERKFCRCHYGAHAAMLLDAKARSSTFVPGSWPHRVISLLEHAAYADSVCHFCISELHGQNAPNEWYGAQIRKHFSPYVDFLLRTTDMDHQTAKAEARRRLSISQWMREDELFQLITRLFPTSSIRREASPEWLGQQRLDIYLPEIALAIEHQGEQHYSPIKAFGGEDAFAKTQERDKRKRRLCHENGVTVVDIRYDDSLTTSNLQHRLRRWLRK